MIKGELIMQPIDTYLEQVTQKDIGGDVDALFHLVVFCDVHVLTAIQNAFFHHEQAVHCAAARAADIQDYKFFDKAETNESFIR